MAAADAHLSDMALRLHHKLDVLAEAVNEIKGRG
ncbi:hypothetical protein SAMN06295955_101619 [Sphingopyxis indica]|uniref:Uncharacterized protein n=1 Tax=Sphingopyxis indica TaxID=436663 RepID=A0A239E5Z8_9SPHN|nr:hypothetical protein SAMN06295955_101619 [Sphingopyxis indica]